MITGMGAQSRAPGIYQPKVCSVSYAHVVFEIFFFQNFYLRTGACEKESVFVI